METTKDYKGFTYTLSNENLLEGDKVYPISDGHLDGQNYIHEGFNFGVLSSGFPDEPHTIINLKHSLDDKGYEVRTNMGYGPIESYFKITKIEPIEYKLVDFDESFLTKSIEDTRKMLERATKRKEEVLKEHGGVFNPIIVDHLGILGGESSVNYIPSGSMGKSNFDVNKHQERIANFTERLNNFRKKDEERKRDKLSRKEMIEQLEKTKAYWIKSGMFDYNAGLEIAINLVRHHGLDSNGLTQFINKPDNE